jgi:hypothetical protein
LTESPNAKAVQLTEVVDGAVHGSVRFLDSEVGPEISCVLMIARTTTLMKIAARCEESGPIRGIIDDNAD